MPPSFNRVLAKDAHTSTNFYRSDGLLRSYLEKYMDEDARAYMDPKLDRLGKQAAGEMEQLSRQADRHSPTLNKRTKLGETIDEVSFHPAYGELVDIAAQSEMFYVKYHPNLRNRFAGNRHKMGFAAGQIYGMSELGVYCPLCMTDGAAYLIDRHASEADRTRLLPKLSAREGSRLFTGAMFLTEKAGGSDVGANLCQAKKIGENRYHLDGEKWFCSNVNADVMMVLARTAGAPKSTKGLSLFLVEKRVDGKRNPIDIIRLKDKLGVRSMATGEVRLTDTVGTLLGKEGEGFKLMAEMINLSRTYNAVAALAGARRAIIEAYQYLNHRITFGKRAVEHALIRQKFYELGARYLADFLLVWRVIRAMDASEAGDDSQKQLLRMIVPMTKWRLGESGVYIVRECMEMMGGNGYIEDFVMPRLLRDVNVLPIWEGAGNIMVLDMLRAAKKSEGFTMVINQIEEAASKAGGVMQERLQKVQKVYKQLASVQDRDLIEATAKPLFNELTDLYQMALLSAERESLPDSSVKLGLAYLDSKKINHLSPEKPPATPVIAKLLGWDY